MCREVETFSSEQGVKLTSTFAYNHSQDGRSNRVCVDMCPDGFQANRDTLVCEKCNKSCQTGMIGFLKADFYDVSVYVSFV